MVGEPIQKTIGIDKNKIDITTVKILVNIIEITAVNNRCTEI